MPTDVRSAPSQLVAAAAGAATAAAYALPNQLADGPVLCPVRHALGIPCPTCGMTRSVVATVHGDLAGAIEAHPFGPLLVLAVLLVVVLGWSRARQLATRVPTPVVLLTAAGWIGWYAAQIA